MRRLSRCCCLLGSAVVAAAVTALPALAQQKGVVASAPIDPAIFREGQVRRLTGKFGAWTVVCDEIGGLKRRYCSLRAQLTGERSRGFLTVSTGDDGRPAALLRAPHGIVLSRNLFLRFDQAGATGASARFDRPLRPFSCDRESCIIVWTLGAPELARLRRGDAISLHYFRWQPQPFPVAELASSAFHKGEILRVTGQGFAEAVAAALK